MVQMKLIGRIGLVEEGQEVYMYQCPICKSVGFNFDSGLECKSCTEPQKVTGEISGITRVREPTEIPGEYSERYVVTVEFHRPLYGLTGQPTWKDVDDAISKLGVSNKVTIIQE